MKNILIFRVGQLGDALVSLPAIKIIKERHANHRLVLLTDCHPGSDYVSSWEIYGPTGWFDDVVFYDPSAVKSLKNAMSLANRLRAFVPEYIYALSPERGLKQLLRDYLFFKYIVGTSYYGGPQFSSINKQGLLRTLPRTEPEWQRLIRIADSKRPGIKFRLDIPEDEASRAHEVLDSEGLKPNSRFLVLGPGSKMPAKIWPIDRYIELGARLNQAFPELSLIILGSKQERVVGERLCSEVGGAIINLAGRLTIYGSAEVLKHSVGYVGNDSGIMHLAGVLGRPCVALFSARDNPGKWEPYGESHLILRHAVECAGCMLNVCNNHGNKCLKLIGVDEVFGAVSVILESSEDTILASD